MKVDLSKVEQEFIDIVIDQAEEHEVAPDQVTLVLFPLEKEDKFSFIKKNKTSFVLRIRELIAGELVGKMEKLNKYTHFDFQSMISKAIIEIFKAELKLHNHRVEHGIESESTRNVKDQVELGSMRCLVTIDKSTESDRTHKGYKLSMMMYSGSTKLKAYDIVEEFGHVDGEEHEVDMSEIKNIK